MTEINHQAIITEIQKDYIAVEIIKTEACNSCALKGVCEQKKQIIIKPIPKGEYHIGEKVVIYINEKQAVTALFFGYILPLLLVLSVLFGCLHFFADEVLSALASLAVLPIYYLVLHFLEKNFKKTMCVKIEQPSKISFNK